MAFTYKYTTTVEQYLKQRTGMPRKKSVQQFMACTRERQRDGIFFRQVLHTPAIEQSKIGGVLVMVYILRDLDRVYIYEKESK